MEASVGIRARPGAWAGLEKPRGAYSARAPPVRLTPEKLPERLALGTGPRRSTGPVLRAAKLKASCCKKSAGTEKVHYSADEALILQQKAQDVLPYLDGRCVYLVGMMGSGKTTVGKILAEVLGYSFFDSDKLVEKAVGISSVAEIFQLHSEAFFRDNESEVLRDLSSMHRLVVATGGGAVIRPINWSYMKKGLTVWLDVPLDALARRIAAVGTASRPLLHQEYGDPYAKAYTKLTSLFEQRMDSYANADARVSLEHIALKQGHNDVTILTPSTIAIEALLRMESFLTEKATVRN
ncbi:shikimate kinase 3, chloroplastic-like isoform X2 [Panicum virgatum]|uniref:shikimate kinase 3, chloroplastic-like isoform X2 n=1 Tax=Panicum virgatum TaxID=38727 RepID=UPI0019D5574B|nr:shikimate kinase 3, chloroplastic-like isoform X2 [Panicum virgatum]